MVRQRIRPLLASTLSALLLASGVLLPVAAAPFAQSEKQYRLAAWHFYQEDYYQALLQLSLAPEEPAKASLFQAGLLLQLDMPAATASLLKRLLDDQTLSGKLPRELRNIALLQFSRYQYEQQYTEQARYYLQQLTPPLAELAGQAELLQQLLNWPDTMAGDPQVFSRLAGQNELPYVVINQILALRQQQQPAQALALLGQLSEQLGAEPQPGFWQRLFSWRAAEPLLSDATEREALADYLQLLKAGLLVDQLQWADAQQVLSEFASSSVLTLSAMTLYRDVLTENRQIPTLLSLLQQLIERFPYAPASWLAAHQLGNQFERALAQQDALAAYRWADQYYQQQLAANSDHASPVQLEQLADPAGLSGWQRYQLRQQAPLFRLNSQLAALQQLQQLQQQRLSQIERLSDVVQIKLGQQQQLLSSTLPGLIEKQQQLQQKAAQLTSVIVAATQQPMAGQLWLDDTEQHFAQLQRMLGRAEERVAALTAAGRDVSQAAARLSRLRGILQWHYQYNSAERRWQLTKQQQQLTAELTRINDALARLTRLDGKTERLLSQQQQLATLSDQESQFATALAARQQQLLAQLNTELQQLRQAERAQLQEMRRVNTQAIARVMEQLLLTTQEGQ
ncbi:hypothetical protein [Arsukibacterium sp.]|uniref:hypothetical protein n=1 Tax=Arsukibacterium sp. TaxID=1977258 RepID=UPI001BD4263B|nr:hypothetical protein [Arsukibacterium sp.]